MKTRMIFIISLLLLCVSCRVEQQMRYDGYSGNNERCTVRIYMPDKWKIVNAEITTNLLTLEFDRGNGIEKQVFPLTFQIIDTDGFVQFRGANRVDGLALLYFTKEEDPQRVFSPPMATSKISKGEKTREVFAVFRTSNWLMIYFSIENTASDNPLFHDLRQQYSGNSKTNQWDNFKLINGVLHLEFGENNKEKRSFPVQKFVGSHENSDRGGGGSSFTGNEISWTRHFNMVSKQKK